MKFLKLSVGMALVAALCLGAAPLLEANDNFPQSVASGDPRPTSVIVWTRLVSETDEAPKMLDLEVATDEAFSDVVHSQSVEAMEENDGCVKVMVSDLTPGTTYYYRFTYQGNIMSQVGRTRTAPDPDSSVPVRFVVVNCQDYVGRYFNPYAKLLADHDDDIDFVVNLGDSVYETDGSPDFQDPAADRLLVFEDLEGAIELGSGDEIFHAARSLANYRTMHKTTRSDAMLQQVHERWPVIFIWDDHEFADDNWGATATYHNGRVDEFDEQRKRDSERAFFEFSPIDAGLDEDGLLAIDDSMLYPHAVIYRDFNFGSNLHLVLTDTRSFRPDHLIPEDAFPGTVVLDQDTLVQALGQPVFDAVQGNFDPYVNLGSLGLNILSQTAALVAAQAYMIENPVLGLTEALGLAQSNLKGNVSTTFINALFDAAGLPAPFDPETQARLPKGVSYLFMGKQGMYSDAGSRYVTIKDTYELYAGIMYQQTAGAAQDIIGGQQMAWLQGVVSQSPATWTVLGSSISMSPLVLDFTSPLIAPALPPDFPDVLRTRLMLTAESWEGFPHKRLEMLGLLGLANNPIVISGDQHMSYVTDHGDGIFEFTAPGIAADTYSGIALRRVLGIPGLGQIPGVELLLIFLDQFIQASSIDDTVVPADILYANSTVHGYLVLEATEETMTAHLHEIRGDATFTNYYDDLDTLDQMFTETVFQVQDGVIQPVAP